MDSYSMETMFIGICKYSMPHLVYKYFADEYYFTFLLPFDTFQTLLSKSVKSWSYF